MNKHSAFNSFLLAASLAVSGWVAKKSAENSEHIAAIQVAIDALKESTAKAERILDRHLEQTVARREFDARVLVFETEQRKFDLRLHDHDLEILKLKQNL